MSLAAANLNVAIESEFTPPMVEDPTELYTTQFNFVWRNLRRLGVPDHLLEDAAQDVFLTVHRRWDTFDRTRSSIQSWLFGIVLRVARGHRRTIRRRLAQLVSMGDGGERVWASPAEGPAELVEQHQSLAVLDRILESMDEDKRAVFLLVDVEEQSVTEAAEVLGVNLNTLYWRLRAARRSFQRAVDRLHNVEVRKLGGLPR